MYRLLLISLFLTLAACQQADVPEPTEPVVDSADIAEPESAPAEQDRMGSILDAQPEEIQARYDQRHPRETLEFFGIEPGRVMFSWVSAAEGERFAEVVREVTENVRRLGPSSRLTASRTPSEARL